MCGNTLPRPPSWLLLLALVLTFCFTSPPSLTAQSTPNAPQPPESKQSIVSSLNSLSDDLVLRLTERDAQSQSFKINFEKMQSDDEARWKLSQGALASLQTEHAATLSELSNLGTDYAGLKQSSLDREAADQKAIKQARAERDGAYVIGGLVGLALGFIADEALHLFKIIP